MGYELEVEEIRREKAQDYRRDVNNYYSAEDFGTSCCWAVNGPLSILNYLGDSN